jgi:hypothetical protein
MLCVRRHPRCIDASFAVYLKLSSLIPHFIFITGNFNDLKRFESLLWPLGVSFAAGSFLWLGDYVDRGASCLVTVLYLLCQKVLNPQKWRCHALACDFVLNHAHGYFKLQKCN